MFPDNLILLFSVWSGLDSLNNSVPPPLSVLSLNEKFPAQDPKKRHDTVAEPK